MNKIEKVQFYGNEIMVIENDNQKYVAMKPIVEALGLSWRDQQRIIESDPVLSSVKGVAPLTGNDGKIYNMVCLPLEYLNGWLFKVPASRYKGKKREAIIRYQKECYNALYDYFHKGAAISQHISLDQITSLIDSLKIMQETQQNMQHVCNLLEQQNNYLAKFHPRSVPGELSEHTGRPKLNWCPGYWTSNTSANPPELLQREQIRQKNEKANIYIQLELPIGGVSDAQWK
jgi:hypothetical protein